MLKIHSIYINGQFMAISHDTLFVNGCIFEYGMKEPKMVVRVITTIEGIKTESTMHIGDVAMWLAGQLQKWG